jgi:hypothetical protein
MRYYTIWPSAGSITIGTIGTIYLLPALQAWCRESLPCEESGAIRPGQVSLRTVAIWPFAAARRHPSRSVWIADPVHHGIQPIPHLIHLRPVGRIIDPVMELIGIVREIVKLVGIDAVEHTGQRIIRVGTRLNCAVGRLMRLELLALS